MLWKGDLFLIRIVFIAISEVIQVEENTTNVIQIHPNPDEIVIKIFVIIVTRIEELVTTNQFSDWSSFFRHQLAVAENKDRSAPVFVVFKTIWILLTILVIVLSPSSIMRI